MSLAVPNVLKHSVYKR